MDKRSETPPSSVLRPSEFMDRALIELKRAERYRVFVALLVMDFGKIFEHSRTDAERLVAVLANELGSKLRASDSMSLDGGRAIHILFPETSRQGAEIASKRLYEIIGRILEEQYGLQVGSSLSVEMASFPDTAGARTLKDYLKELPVRCNN